MQENDENQMQPHELNDTQKYILSIMEELVDIFRKMEIPYYMQGGTMLGAVRHKGFIPWDDDIDIGVFREDYERLVHEVQNYLPEHLELRTYWDETDHHYYFSRIVDNRYLIKRMGSLEVRYENVWIDIFPLDGMPNGTLARAWHKVRLLHHRVRYHLATLKKVNTKRPGRPLVERVIIKVAAVTHIGSWFNAKKELDRVDRLLKKYPIAQSDWIVNFMGQTSYKFNELFRKEVYGKTTYYPFEHLRLPGPEQYDAYLTSLYGDYMMPPRECDRNAHAAELVRNEASGQEER